MMPLVDKNRPRHVFSVDVEDYFQVSAFDRCISREQWDTFSCRVESNTHKLLKLLDDHQVRATFYVLGWIAERYPRLIQQISLAGHEIGTHGYWHRLIYTQTPAEFRADLRQSIAVLEEIIDRPITAYRAPSFSITQNSRWALEIMIEEGISADSSIVPIRHDLYGFPGAQAGLHRLETPSGSIWEYPPAIFSFWKNKFTLPVGGGGYFRIYPYRFTQWCLQQLVKQNESLMFYIHPWEVDPDQPRLRASLKSRLRHYSNLHRTLPRLDRLLADFSFGPLRDVLAEQERNVFSPKMAAIPWL